MEHEPRRGWGEQLRVLMHERTLTIVTIYVVCAGVWIAATDWLLSRIAQDAHAVWWLSTVKGELFVGGTALLLLLHLRRERRVREANEARIRRQAVGLEAAAQHMRESEERYRTLFESGPFPKVLYDPATFAILAVNNAAVELYGYGRDELLAMTIKDVRPPEEIDKLAAAFAQPLPDRYHAGVWTHRKKDGTHIEVDVYTHAVLLGGRPLRLAELHDITEKKRAEAALRRANRALRMISLCNQHVVRARDEGGLLREVCRILVEQGGYRLAWVGYAERDEEHTVRPVALHGFGEAYVRTARISWGENDRGRGPTGRAIRTGAPCHAHNLQTDPTFGPWRDEAARHGYRASVALPLRGDAQVFGALNLYAGDIDAFDAEETALLSELADDLAYGILALRTAAERAQAQQALALRTEQLEAVRAVTAEIAQELDVTRLLELITHRAVDLVGARHGSIRLWDETEQVLVPKAWTGAGSGRVVLRLRLGEGVAGMAAERREGVIVNDVESSPDVRPVLMEGTIHPAILAEPLLSRDRLLGVLAVVRDAPMAGFTDEDRQLIALFAGQAAIAIENTRLHEAAVRHGTQMEALLRSFQSVTSGLDLRQILDRIIAEAARIANTPHVKILLLDQATQGLRVASAQGGTVQPDFPASLGRSLSGTVAATGQPLFVADSQDESQNPNAAFDRQKGLRTYLGLPIKGRHGILGVLTFNTADPRTYSDEELSYLTSFAHQAAIAIDNARLYAAVQAHAAELEEAVARRTAELERANGELQAASRYKSEFLANMSHEIRTPLNSILGFAQLLREQTEEILSPKQTRFLTNIHRSGEHLLQLINDILDLSKVEAGKTKLEPIPLDVPQVLEEILVIARGLAHKKSQHIEIQIAPDLAPLRADSLRLKQICFNLLSNAVKFTPDGGRITVAAQPTADAAFLDIRVTDTGIGIRAEDLPRLFQEFVQLEAAAALHHEGTGLGLALTKRLVEMHGGTIAATSPGEGQGSTFTVRLPFAGPAAPAEVG